MGNFYTNITLAGAGGDDTAAALARFGRRAYVGTWDGDTVVFDEQGESQDGSHAELAAELSAALACPALATLNHDDDLLVVHAFEGGDLVGELCSDPDQLVEMTALAAEMLAEVGELDLGGVAPVAPTLTAAALGGLFPAARPDRLAALLDKPRPVFASEFHEELVAALGLPAAAVGRGFTSLARGEGGPTVRLIG